jgi:hypothetical protein
MIRLSVAASPNAVTLPDSDSAVAVVSVLGDFDLVIPKLSGEDLGF